jgi:hypothetical protein
MANQKSAIILASDMAFLAIPGVDHGLDSTSSQSFSITFVNTTTIRLNNDSQSNSDPRSLAQVLSYASVISSVACIVSALLHARRQSKMRKTADDVVSTYNHVYRIIE